MIKKIHLRNCTVAGDNKIVAGAISPYLPIRVLHRSIRYLRSPDLSCIVQRWTIYNFFYVHSHGHATRHTHRIRGGILYTKWFSLSSRRCQFGQEQGFVHRDQLNWFSFIINYIMPHWLYVFISFFTNGRPVAYTHFTSECATLKWKCWFPMAAQTNCIPNRMLCYGSLVYANDPYDDWEFELRRMKFNQKKATNLNEMVNTDDDDVCVLNLIGRAGHRHKRICHRAKLWWAFKHRRPHE